MFIIYDLCISNYVLLTRTTRELLVTRRWYVVGIMQNANDHN